MSMENLNVKEQKIKAIIDEFIKTQNCFIDDNGINHYYELIKTISLNMNFKK